jgi:hypothetical protein
MTEWERIKAESRATIARVDKLLGQAPAPEPVVIETRAARWRRQDAERKAAVEAENERRRVDDWMRRSAAREQQQQAQAHQVANEEAHDLTIMLAKEVGTVLDDLRDQIANLTERTNKLQSALDEIQAERSFDRAVAKAHGEIVTLPTKRVS